MPMTPRERALTALRGGRPDRVPKSIGFTPDALATFQRGTGGQSPAEEKFSLAVTGGGRQEGLIGFDGLLKPPQFLVTAPDIEHPVGLIGRHAQCTLQGVCGFLIVSLGKIHPSEIDE